MAITKIAFKILLSLTLITIISVSIISNYKIFERVDKIFVKYSKFYGALADDKSYQQIPTNIQIEMETTSSSLLMLHSVSGKSSNTFGILLGLCIILILINTFMEIRKDLLKIRYIQSRLNDNKKK
jgi:preprotein translocase subunit SecF